jgi:murein L,D-transpeptidase YcbB/YkuD
MKPCLILVFALLTPMCVSSAPAKPTRKPANKVAHKAPVLQWPRISRANQSEYLYEIGILQQLLNWRGEKIKVDGQFGAETEMALKRFQRKHGLAADGVAGPQSWPKLITRLMRGSKGEAVSVLQDALTGGDEEYSGEFEKERGVFGFETERAVRALQKERGLTVDGIAGPQTWCVLLGGKVLK